MTTRCEVTSINVLGSNGGTRGGGLVHPKGENSMAMFGLGCENPSVGAGEPFFPLDFKCKWTQKTVSYLTGPPCSVQG